VGSGRASRPNFAPIMDESRALDPLAVDWTLAILLVSIALLGWINLVSPRKWPLILRSVFSYRLGRQSLRDELDLQDRSLISLLIMACGVSALFATQVAVLSGGAENSFLLWLRMFGTVVGVVVVQVMVLRSMAVLFQGDGGITEYLYTALVFHIAAGLVLLPFTALLAYPHEVGWRGWLALAAGVLLALITLFRWLRAALVGWGEGVPLRYILIYLCALEFLPVAILLEHLRTTNQDLSVNL